MRPGKRAAVAAALFLAFAAGACEQAAMRTGEPMQSVEQAALARLDALGIPRADVDSIVLGIERAQESNVVSHRAAWVRLKTCQGYVVMNLDRYNDVVDVYTTGNCRLPGR
jgi:hypothetical protein